MATSADEPVGLAEFANILRRRWLVIAATTLAMLAMGVAFLAVTKPIFAASTQVFVDPRNRAAFQIEGTGTGAGYDPNLVDSQVVIIESESVLRRVVDMERLAEDPEFQKGDGDARANALYNLKEAVKVRRPDRTYVVEIEVRTRDAAKSARLANAVARAYLSDGRDSKSETSRREESWLDQHLAALQKRMRAAEDRVEKFRVEKRIVGVGVDGRSVVEQRLSELNKGGVEAQRRVADARATLEQVELLRKTGRLPDATSEAIRSTSIERLRAQLAEILRLEANSRSTLGPRHPAAIEIREQVREVRRQIDEELRRVAEAARNAYTTARNNEAAIEKQIDMLKGQTAQTNQTLVELRELERAVEAQKAVYTKFLNDKEQIARLMLDTPAGRVIAPAVVPTRKAFPNKVLVLGLALVAGLLIGVALALAIETLAAARRGHRLRMQPGTASAPFADGEPVWGGAGASTPHPKRHVMADETVPAQPLAILSRAGQTRRMPALRLDAWRVDPTSDFSREVTTLALRLVAMPRARRQPLMVMLVAGSPQADAKMLAANLAFAMQGAGETALMIEANPDGAPLGALAPIEAIRLSMPVFGQSQVVTPLPGADGTGPFLLLPPSSHAWTAMPASPARPCSVVIIEGPAAGSPALETMRLERRIDAVLVVQEQGAPVIDSALPAGLAESLVGTIELAA